MVDVVETDGANWYPVGGLDDQKDTIDEVIFNKPLFKLACAKEKILEHPKLHKARVHLIGVYQISILTTPKT